MSADDPLADWARSRRSESVPDEFSRRVMEAISANPGRFSEPRPAHRQRERLERWAGLLLVVCSCIVAVVRLSSLVDLVANAPSFADPTTQLPKMLDAFKGLVDGGTGTLTAVKDLF